MIGERGRHWPPLSLSHWGYVETRWQRKPDWVDAMVRGRGSQVMGCWGPWPQGGVLLSVELRERWESNLPLRNTSL